MSSAMIKTIGTRADGVSRRVGSPRAWLLFLLSLGPVLGCSDTARTELQGDRFDPVRTLIEERMKEYNIASISIVAAEGGAIVWEESFGWADKENEIPANTQSTYALASITKSLTATALMVLVERGLVDLDKPVNDYLPEAKLTCFAGGKGGADQATVRRVLRHEAGLPMHVNIFGLAPGSPRPPDQDESIRRYGIIVEEPGTEYRYSNFGYGVLDRVIAAVSGGSYADFMKTEVFAPLGMIHSSVMVDSTLHKFAVRSYDAQGKPVPPLDFDHRGASAVYASVHDLIRFAMSHLKTNSPDQTKILSDASIDLMHEPSQVRVADAGMGEVRMGLGWAIVDLLGRRFVSTSGGMPGTITRLTLIPKDNAAVAIAMNSGISESYSPWDIEWETFSAMLPGFPERPEIPEEKHDRSPFPPELVGEWTGTVTTYERILPVRLSVANDSNVSLDLDGTVIRPVPVQNPLGFVGFRDGFLEGPFFGEISTGDAKRSPHVLFIRLRLRDESLRGCISAIAMNRSFILPSAMALKKVGE